MVWLDNSRIFAIYSVIVLHVAADVVLGNDVGSEYWWYGNLIDSIVRWCVPVFVMISGALLLDPHKNESLLIFYKKRLSKILLPILFWSVFYLSWASLKNILHGNEPTALELIKKLLSGRPYYHMWFLYMILSLYLFTPFFRKIISHSTRKEIILLVFIMFLFAGVNYIYRKLVSYRHIHQFLKTPHRFLFFKRTVTYIGGAQRRT